MHARSTFSLVLGLLALGLGTSLGCAGTPTAEKSDGEPMSSEIAEQDQAIIGGGNEETCCWGSYTCPRTGASYDYEQARCGTATKPRAQSVCHSKCGVPCEDSGWVCE